MSSSGTDIIPATLADLCGMLVREEDAFELNCLGLTTEQALEKALEESEAWAGVMGGKIACAWGIIPQSGLTPSRLWLLTSPSVDHHAITFLRLSRKVVDAMLRRHGVLESWVLERNTKSVRWMEWLGFRFYPPFVLDPVGSVRRCEKWLG